jgi:small-conductance mechanosensitive channel
VFVFRASVGAVTPRDRARFFAERIDALTRKGGVAPVTLAQVPEGWQLRLGDEPLFIVRPGDAASDHPGVLRGVALDAAARLEAALAAQAESRSLPHMLRATGLAALVTVAAALLALLLRAGRRRLTAWLARRVARAAEIEALRSVAAGTMALQAVRALATLVTWGVALAGSYVWLTVVLNRFPYTRPWGETLRASILQGAAAGALAVLDAAPQVLTVAVILFVARRAQRLLALWFEAVQAGRVRVSWIHPDTALSTRRILTLLLWLFIGVLVYHELPFGESPVFRTVSVFVGLLFTFGSTGLVNQMMSGFTITYSRSFRAGDYILVGDVEGTVLYTGLLATRIRTPWQEVITVPNAVVVGTRVQNYSEAARAGQLVVHTEVTIGYDAPWRQVHALLLMAAARTPGLRTEPAPSVQQLVLADFYIRYRLAVYLERADTRIATLARLHEQIQDCFNQYGVQIMSPHYMTDRARPAVVPPERWHTSPAASPPPEEGGIRGAPDPPGRVDA